MGSDRVTVIYDNRSSRGDLRPGWGFSALIELGGQRVLFDTGPDKLVLEHNAAALGIDLATTDSLVLSHEHCDHIGAVTSALHEGLDVFYPASFSTLFQGEVKGETERARWRAHPVSTPTEIVAGIISTGELGKDIAEQALLIRGPAGPTLITGCAHPGIVEIVRVATELAGGDLHLVLGGFHLYKKNEHEIRQIASALQKLGVKKVGPCHCTGERAIGLLQDVYGANGLDVMAGTTIAL